MSHLEPNSAKNRAPLHHAIDIVALVGAPIAIVSLLKVLTVFDEWIGDGKDHAVILRDVHGVMRARREKDVREAQEAADLVLPDGMPLVWLAKLTGFGEISRVCGIDLLPAVFGHGESRRWRHYLYGAAPGVASALAVEMKRKFPGIQIVGTHCPPFRPLTSLEDDSVCADIRAARPDFIWVSLSTPKQDIWMKNHLGKFGGSIMVGVGGAFEINAGLIPRSPFWMQRSGLEWLYRLLQEPTRLWLRYIEHLPLFMLLACVEVVKRRLGAAAAQPDNAS